MSLIVDGSNYPELYTFSMLSRTNIVGSSSTYPIVINPGGSQYYGVQLSSGSTLDVSGGTLLAYNNLALVFAYAQLSSSPTNLITTITYYATYNTLVAIPTAVSGTIIFLPNTNYGIGVGMGDLTIDATDLKFISSSSTDQFFISVLGGSLIIQNVTSIDPAGPSNVLNNVFFYANTNIYINNCQILGGSLIARSGSILIDSLSSGNMYGNLFTEQGSILVASGATTSFNITGNTLPAVCYLKGTKILTQQGYVAIEDLQENDRVVTKGRIHKNKYILKEKFDLEPIVWIGHFNVSYLSNETAPICIRQDALGINYPNEDLFVSPNHGIIVKDELVAARHLINGKTIFQAFDHEESPLVYYHLELSQHTTIVANGLLAETYLETEGNRRMFQKKDNTFLEKV